MEVKDFKTVWDAFFYCQHHKDLKTLQAKINEFYSKNGKTAKFITFEEVVTKFKIVCEEAESVFTMDYKIRVEQGIVIGTVRIDFKWNGSEEVITSYNEGIIDPTKMNPQGSTSTEKYCMRRGLCATFGLVEGKDDDGNAGSIDNYSAETAAAKTVQAHKQERGKNSKALFANLFNSKELTPASFKEITGFTFAGISDEDADRAWDIYSDYRGVKTT